MNGNLGKYKNFIVAGIVALILILGFILYQTFRFHITGTTPDNTSFPASLGSIEIKFNKELDKLTLEERLQEDVSSIVTSDFEGAIRVVVDGKKIKLIFSRTPEAGSYKITLINIPSLGGDTLSKTLPFKTVDKAYEDLNSEERKLFDSFAAEVRDGDDQEYPLLGKLPYETDKYQISYNYEHEDPAPTVIITMKFFEPGNNAVPATAAEKAAYLADVRKYRNQALEWLKSQGATFDKYTLVYTEPELREEFPRGKGRYYNVEADPPHAD